jgi:hypothetical protein
MDGVNSGTAQVIRRGRLGQTAIAIGALLGGAYRKPVPLDLVLWLPALLYYLWLNQLIWIGMEFVTPAGQIRGILFLVCQGSLLFLGILVADGFLAGMRSRWRVAFVAGVHVFLASLYVDCVLYRIMALHLGTGVGMLFQGGFARLRINWAHTGIPFETLQAHALWGAILITGILGYSWVMGAAMPRFRAARSALRVKSGRLALLTVYLLAVCQVLTVSDDREYRIAFTELRKSMPLCFGGAGAKPGRPFVVPGLRPLRDARETAQVVEDLEIKQEIYPDIFVFVLESARSDFIEPGITPNLARLRSECLAVPVGLAAANASHVSWYSLLTANHGLYFGAAKQQASAGSVPLQLFRRMGYRVNVLCSSTLDYHEVDRLAFGDGLKLCDSLFDAQKSRLGDAPSRDLAVNERLLQALDRPPGNRLFLIFYHSTHHDYDWPAGDPAPFTPYAMTWSYGDFNISPERLALIMNRYRNAFHFQDRLIGQFLARLKTNGSYENSVIAVTGDHGEEFLEHGKLLHASNLFSPQTRVPFLLRLPPNATMPSRSGPMPAGTHVDLLPTILDFLGVSVTNLFDGESLFRKTSDEVVIAAENRDWDPVRFCLQSPHGKAFFEYEHERRPTTSQRALYLRQITDPMDRPVKFDLTSPEATSFLRTNFGTVLQSLLPGFEL